MHIIKGIILLTKKALSSRDIDCPTYPKIIVFFLPKLGFSIKLIAKIIPGIPNNELIKSPVYTAKLLDSFKLSGKIKVIPAPISIAVLQDIINGIVV